MKEQLRKAVAGICFTIILFFVIFHITSFFERKGSKEKYTLFYEHADEFDVLFLGSSVIRWGVYPAELWNDYGIVSYNMANSAEYMPQTYWVLKNSLDYCKPKLVVLDMTLLAGGDIKDDGTKRPHNYFDSLPLSKNKILAVTDLYEKGKRSDYLWSLMLYHSRWKDITEEDYWAPSPQMGASRRIKSKACKKPKIGNYKKSRDDKSGFEYVDKIVKLCEKEDIDLLFTYMPFSRWNGEQIMRDYCKEYTQKNNFAYLDYLELDVVDFRFDFAEHVHVNASGGRKITKFIGEYILENYDIPNRKKDEKFKHWDENYVKYKDYKDECIKSQMDLKKYLMLLCDESYRITYSLKEDSAINDDSYVTDILENIDSKKMLEKSAEMNVDIEILVFDKETGSKIDEGKFVLNENSKYQRQ